ncbi:AAA family ATPase [Maridesulfovibrio salexigens]|uniref:Endonuclease GajA/Old nuclease/RecF-like AAA domain-containing protein n=1 Tax=Maridesulfovibrio salexigens (strain ATCC 14822 / DSM 2638 / NCIMB 8403 / VKM B-1763) TaxID=526222 RepID=C6C041_MARSD|nr:AAA family ATPase [Maridesulfovibrio salexigens]ACS80912.1 conserved hypothetical protein [Maridesulfovibrio salexigens DSM 2638]
MKLLIENFYNIKHAELDFKKFNILIGPQAAGKSLIAKVMYLFEEIYTIQSSLNYSEDEFKKHLPKLDELFKSIFETQQLQQDFSLFLSICPDVGWKISTKGLQTLNINQIKKEKFPDEESIDLINQVRELFKKNKQEKGLQITNDSIEKIVDLAQSELSKYGSERHLFIPASRSLVSIIADNTFWLSSNNVELLLNRFGQVYTKQLAYETADKCSYSCPPLKSIIKGEIIKTTPNKYIIINKDRKVTLSNASSGQQSTIPILIALNKLENSAIQTTYIEEPEAHIFPDAQNLLTRYIAEIHNQTGTNITLTTHSPYLLTTVNTLIYANTVASQSEEKAAKVREIIPESEWLKAEDVAAYMVNEDGTVESIFDEEEGLIVADAIDDISDVIGSKYNELLDIEFDEEEQDD